MFLNDNHSKNKTFKNLDYHFIFESTKIENKRFSYKTGWKNLRGVQNGPTVKNGVLPLTTLYFRKFKFSIRTSYKYLLSCINYSNSHIYNFLKCLSFIWGCVFRYRILNRNSKFFLELIYDKMLVEKRGLIL